MDIRNRCALERAGTDYRTPEMLFALLFPNTTPSWLPRSRENPLVADTKRASISTCGDAASRNWTN